MRELWHIINHWPNRRIRLLINGQARESLVDLRYKGRELVGYVSENCSFNVDQR